MIYLSNTTGSQRVVVPATGITPEGAMSLELYSTVDLELKAEAEAVPLNEPGHCFLLEISLPEGLPSGSYEYRVTRKGETLTSGVAQVGDYPDPSPAQYEKEINYVQYE